MPIGEGVEVVTAAANRRTPRKSKLKRVAMKAIPTGKKPMYGASTNGGRGDG